MITLAGDKEPLEELAEKLEAEGKFVRLLRINYAFHTHQMEPIKDDLLKALADIKPQATSIPYISTVTGGAVFAAKSWTECTGGATCAKPCFSPRR